MNIDKLRKELEADEGRVDKIYLDHLGLHTFGIGHLVTAHDKEYGWPVDTDVDADRVVEAFESDVKTVIGDCNLLYDDFEDLPEEAQRVIANMMFNMRNKT